MALPAPQTAQVRELSAVPAFLQHPSAPCCPLAGHQHDAGVLEGVRAVADLGVGKGSRLFGGAGQPVTPAAANKGSLSASCPANTSPSVAAHRARSSARGPSLSAAAGSGQRLSLTELSRGPLCGEQKQTRSRLPLRVLWVTKYDVALLHPSLPRRRVSEGLGCTERPQPWLRSVRNKTRKSTKQHPHSPSLLHVVFLLLLLACPAPCVVPGRFGGCFCSSGASVDVVLPVLRAAELGLTVSGTFLEIRKGGASLPGSNGGDGLEVLTPPW